MIHLYWNDTPVLERLVLWLGLDSLVWNRVSDVFKHWQLGYIYRAHRKYGDLSAKDGLDILNERYACGETTQDDLKKMRAEISKT